MIRKPTMASKAWAGGGDWQPQQQIQQIPVQKKAYVEVPVKQTAKTDNFIQIVSDIHWGWLVFIGFCIVIGAVVSLTLFLKLTPLGRLIIKAADGLKSMFKALIEWSPKGNEKKDG
jgi:hypothetical protein